MKVMQIKVEYIAGTSFDRAFLAALELAIRYDTEVVGKFNGFDFLIDSDKSYNEIYTAYHVQD